MNFTNINGPVIGLENAIFLNISSEYQKVELEDICYIKGYGDYMQFNLDASKHLVHTTMSKVEETLPHDKFFRLHRSYIVRLDKIEKLYSNSVVIKGVEIPVSKKKKQELFDLLPKFQ